MIRKSIIAAAATAFVAIPVAANAATELKTLACFQRNHDYVVGLHQEFVDPINTSKGAISIKYLGGPEVTPRTKQAGAVKRGLVDIIFCPSAYYGGQLMEARLPGAHNKSLDEIRKNGGWDLMQDAWGKGLNSRLLAWTHFGGQKFYMYTKFKPKLSEKTGLDLKGVKFRGTGLYKAFMKAMGATVVVISPGDVYSALERGVVDGVAWPWGSMATYGWEKFLKYRIEPDFFGATMTLLINLDKWKSMSKAEQMALDAAARSYEKGADAIMVKKGHEDDAKLKKAGIETIKLTGKVRDAYLRTIYEAKWAENDSFANKSNVDYKMLKSKLYDASK